MLRKFSLLMILIFCLSGCQAVQHGSDSDNIKIICTTFPQYDWVRELIAGAEEETDLILLADNGTDIHSYQPSADDIISISNCDILIYTGGNSEAWIEDAIKNSANDSVKLLNMLDIVGDNAISEKHEHDDSKHQNVKDEHVWLSIRNAELICDEITNALCEISPENAEMYRKNYQNYMEKLEELDKEYKRIVNSSVHKTLIFADRFPFRYLTDEYGILYYAAFPGCSAESEASFETVINLANKLDSLKIDTVLITDNLNSEMAKTVIMNTTDKDQDILSLSSMQSVNDDELNAGISYYSVMRDNLEVLEKALN